MDADIPLCGTAATEVPNPPRNKISADDVGTIVNLMISRLNAIRGQLVPGKLGSLVSAALGVLLNTWIISGKVKDGIRAMLIDGLAPNV